MQGARRFNLACGTTRAGIMTETTTTPSQNKNRRKEYEGVTAGYDAARHTPDAMSIWRNADSLAATTLNNPMARKVLRDRARYETANNSLLFGIIDTYVTDLVGAWVTLHLPEEVPEKTRQQILQDFDDWCCRSHFWQKLRLLVRAKVIDGEGFAQFFTDRNLDADVKLNLSIFECDRVESWSAVNREDEIDGIRFDEYGRPTQYRVLKYHPGDYRTDLKTRAGEWIKAKDIIHYFDQTRPEQVRGVSDLVSGLELPVKLRSYTNSVIDAASRAAEISGVLETDQIPECFDGDGESIGRCAMEVTPNTIFNSERGGLVTLPEGWKLNQLKSEQPTSTYPQFKREIVADIGRMFSMPYNIAACDSSNYNYASGRLDHMTYDSAIATRRSVISTEILDRVFFAWFEEWMIGKNLPQKVTRAAHRTEWLFSRRGNADPLKDANADKVRLDSATSTLSDLYAKDGKDWRRQAEQAVEERVTILAIWRKQCKAKGLPEDTPCPFGQEKTTPAAPPKSQPKSDDATDPQKTKQEPK